MMDERKNTFDDPGGNYPDAGTNDAETRDVDPDPETDASPETGSDHYGQDHGRDTLTVAQSQDQALSDEQAQALPGMDQNNADQAEKVAGIVVQTRADLTTQPLTRVPEMLSQRLEQAGISLPAETVDALARQIVDGDVDVASKGGDV